MVPQPASHSPLILTFDRVAPGKTIEHGHAIAVSHSSYANNVVYKSRVCYTLALEGRGNVHLHHAARINVDVVPEGPGQRAAACLLEDAQTDIWIHDLIQPGVDFLPQIVIKIQRVKLNDLTNVSRDRGVPLR